MNALPPLDLTVALVLPSRLKPDSESVLLPLPRRLYGAVGEDVDANLCCPPQGRTTHTQRNIVAKIQDSLVPYTSLLVRHPADHTSVVTLTVLRTQRALSETQ